MKPINAFIMMLLLHLKKPDKEPPESLGLEPSGYNDLLQIKYSGLRLLQNYCYTVFSRKTYTNPVFAYAASPFTTAQFNQWTDFFQVTDLATCPWQSCALKQPGCAGAFSGSKITIDATQTLLSLKTNVIAGYTKAAGLECYIGTGATSANLCFDFFVTQSSFQCSSKLTLGISPTNPTYAFSSSVAQSSPTTGVSFFLNADSTNCPTTSCQLMNSGCSVAFTGTYVLMATVSPWTINVVRNYPTGWTESMCIQCTNDNYGQSFETKNSGTYTVVQSPVTCNVKMAAKSGATLIWVLNYDLTTTSLGSIVVDYTTNSDTLYCNMMVCILKEADCTTNFAGSEVSLNNVYPFELTAIRNVKAGHTVLFCVSCNNDQHSQTYQTITTSITLVLNHICQTSMVTASTLPLNPTKNFDSSTTTEVVLADSRVIYTENYASDCTSHSCLLLDSTCSSTYSGFQASIGASPTYAITMQKNVIAGHVTAVCISCTNGYDIVTYVYTMTQNPLSCLAMLTVIGTLPAEPTQAYNSGSPSFTVGDMNTFFVNANTADCPVTSCTLYRYGCSTAYATAYPTGKISKSSASPFTLSSVQNIAIGWTEQICYSCTNGAQTITYDLFDVTQTASPCVNSLSAVSSPPSNPTFAYSTSTPTQSPGSWTTFYQNSLTSTCPVTSCSLLDQGCAAAYSYIPARTSIGGSTPFTLTSTVNVNNGWVETVCISCTNGAQIVTHDNFIITQTQNPCKTVLSLQTGPTPTNPLSLTYSSSPTTQSIGGWNTFFANSDTTNCAVSTCSLKNLGCSTSYTGTNLLLSGTTFIAFNNLPLGYTENFCIQCTNDAGSLTLQTFNLDNYKVVQGPSPCGSSLSAIIPSPTNPFTFAYHASNTQAIGDWTTFVTCNNSPTCDPTACTLYGAGCSTLYATAYPSGMLTLGSSTPFALTSQMNSNVGFTETVCISCTNLQDTQNTDNYVITQTASPCLTHLAAKTPVPTNPTFAFNSAGSETLTSTWNDLIGKSAASGCDPTSCTVYGNDCTTAYSTAYPSGRVTMGAFPNYGLTSLRGVGSGWTETICFSCTNGLDTQIFSSYVIVQTPDPCASSLSTISATVTNPRTFAYHASNTEVWGGWTYYFANSQSSACDPTTCTLWGVGCSSAYSSVYPSGKITMAGSSPWGFTSVKNVMAGWSEYICLKCTNGQQTINYDSIVIKQDAVNCYTTLSAPSTLPTNPLTIAYASSPTTQTIGTWSTFAQNSDTSGCPVTSCSIKAIGCSGAYTGSYLTITGSPPTTISAQNNVIIGWSETVCISCTNTASGVTFDTETTDNYNVVQTANPCGSALAPFTTPIPVNPIAFTYDISNTGAVGDWTTFIANSGAAACDPTSCLLYGIGCSTVYSTAFPAGMLTISGTSPFMITSLRNSLTSWSEKVCLVCTNGLATVQIDNYEVIQSNNPCYTSLSAKTTPGPTNPKIFAYSLTPTTGTVGAWTNFVDNLISPTCDPTTTTILAQGCVNTYASAYPAGRLSISGTSILAQINSHSAWSEQVCVKIVHEVGGVVLDTVYTDNYSIQQTQNPCKTSLTAPMTSPTNPQTFAFHISNVGAVGTWVNFMDNADTTNCAVTSCKFFGQGCSTPYATAYPTGRLTITSTTFTAALNIYPGWTETICVSCTNDIPFNTFDTQTFDNYVVTQTASGCYTSLSLVVGYTNPVTFTYDGVLTHAVGPWGTFVLNSLNSFCPVDTITMYGSDCTTPYATAYPSGQMSIGASPTFIITANRNVVAGYTELVCITYTNNGFSQIFDSVTVINFQVIQQVNPCSNSLSPIVSAPSDPTFSWHASNVQTLGAWSIFVANSISPTCDPTSCTLLAAGCFTPYATAYPNSHITLVGTPATTVQAIRTVHAGYAETICIQCTISVGSTALDIEWYDVFTVTQTSNPCYTSLSLVTMPAPTDPFIFAYNAAGTEAIGDSTNFFSNSVGGCGITSCIFYAAGCSIAYSTAYPLGRVSVAATGTFAITALRNINAGYTETLCFSCTNAGLGTITVDNYDIVQSPDPCVSALSVLAAPNPWLVSYNLPATNPMIGDETTYFMNLNLAGCTTTTMTLFDAACTVPYATAFPAGHLTISGTAPFPITAADSVFAGWTETICISLTNGAALQTATLPNYVVTQTGHPCRFVLSAASPANPNSFAYNSATMYTTIGTHSLFFTNSNVGTCPMTSCSLLAPGCLTAYTGIYVQMTAGTPWTVTALHNLGSGFTDTVCIKCTNDAGGFTLDTQSFDNYVVTQVPMNYASFCGAATPLITQATRWIVGGQELGTPVASLATNVRYLSTTQVIYGPLYYTYTSSPAACKPYKYEMFQTTTGNAAPSPSVFTHSDYFMYGTHDVDLEIRVDLTVAQPEFFFWLRAYTLGGLLTADQLVSVTVCGPTNFHVVTPPSNPLLGTVPVGASGAAAMYAFAAFTVSNHAVNYAPSCQDANAILGYEIVASATALTYVQYPATAAVGCTTRTACLQIEVINTAAPATINFVLQLKFAYKQNPTPIPVTIWVTACGTASVTVPVHPVDIFFDRSATVGSTQSELMIPTYTTLFALSSAATCPLLSLHLTDTSNVALANPSVSMQNGATLSSASILIVTDTAFTLAVRLVGTIAGSSAYGAFNVRVCGAETIANTTSTPTSFAFAIPAGAPASMAAATRYETLLEATLAAWFTVQPTGDPCVLKEFKPLSAVSPDTAWPASDSLVSVSGSIGAHILQIDKAVATSSQKTIFLQAGTRGLVTAWVRILVVVCSPNSLVDVSGLSTITASYYRYQSDPGLYQASVFPHSSYASYFQAQSCSYCASPSFRLLNSDNSLYTDSTLTLDAQFNIMVSTSNPFSTPLLLEAYYDSGSQGECHGMLQPLSKAIRLDVCGLEQVSVVDRGVAISYDNVIRRTPDYTLPLSEFAGNFSSSSSFCLIDRYELRSEPGSPLSETGATVWSSFIQLNKATSQIEVNLFSTPQMANGTEFEIYLVALTVGDAFGAKTLKFKFSYPPLNLAPSFAIALEDQTVWVSGDEQILGMEKPIFQYFLPKITDSEGNTESVGMTLKRAPPCGCIQLSSTTGRAIVVDKRRVSAADHGTYELSLELTDNMYFDGQQKNTYKLKLSIEYTKPEIIVFQNKKDTATVNNIIEADVKQEEEGIPPTRWNERVEEIVSQEEVQEMELQFLRENARRKYPKRRDAEPDVQLKIKNITASGLIYIELIPELLVPPFKPWIKVVEQVDAAYNWTNQGFEDVDEWAMQNYMGLSFADSDQSKKGRSLAISHELLNVTRDVMDFKFLKNSDQLDQELEYDLYIKEWESDHMILYCNFTNPEAVSTGFLFDEARITVTNRYLFTSASTGKILNQENSKTEGVFPQQALQFVDVKVLAKQAAATGDAATALFYIQFFAQLCLKGSLDDLWTLYFTVQVMVYLPIYDVLMPTNVDLYIGELRKVVEFEILNPAGIIRIWDPTFTYAGFLLGIERKRNLLDDLSVYIIAALTLALFLLSLTCCVALCRKFQSQLKKSLRRVKKLVFWNLVIRSFTIAYLKMCISVGYQLELQHRGFQDSSSKTEVAVAAVLGAFMLLFPILCIYLLQVNREQLAAPYVSKRISNLYLGIHIYRDSINIWYYPVFMLRRVIFVAIPTVLVDWAFLQIQLLVFLSSLYVMFYAGLRPHEDPRRVRLEIFNECMLMLLNYHFVIFSNFNLDNESKYTMGKVYLVIVALTIFVNISLIITASTERQLRRLRIKLKKKLRLQMHLEQQARQIERQKEEEASEVLAQHLKDKSSMEYLFRPENLAEQIQAGLLIEQNPSYFKKRIKLEPVVLRNIEPRDRPNIVRDINTSIANDIGTFGDLWQQARKEICAGYKPLEPAPAPPKVKVQLPAPGGTLKERVVSYIVAEPPAPSEQMALQLQKPEIESSRKRWEQFYKDKNMKKSQRVKLGLTDQEEYQIEKRKKIKEARELQRMQAPPISVGPLGARAISAPEPLSDSDTDAKSDMRSVSALSDIQSFKNSAPPVQPEYVPLADLARPFAKPFAGEATPRFGLKAPLAEIPEEEEKKSSHASSASKKTVQRKRQRDPARPSAVLEQKVVKMSQGELMEANVKLLRELGSQLPAHFKDQKKGTNIVEQVQEYQAQVQEAEEARAQDRINLARRR